MKVKQSLVLVIGLCACSPVQFERRSQQQNLRPTRHSNPALTSRESKRICLVQAMCSTSACLDSRSLSSTVQVDSDGNLSSLPFLETPIKAKCRSDKEVQKDIAAAYAKFINNPQVSVRISERNSRQPATVFGAVRQPTRVEMKERCG